MPQNTTLMPFKESEVVPKCIVNSGVVPRPGKLHSDAPKTDRALTTYHGPVKGGRSGWEVLGTVIGISSLMKSAISDGVPT